MQLFAIIAKADENSSNARNVVRNFLKQQLSKEQVHEYLLRYDEFLKQHEDSADSEKKKRRLAVSSVKVIVICEQINEGLNQKQKFIVLLKLIEFVNSKGTISGQEMEFISTVSSSFKISDEEFSHCLNFSTKGKIAELEDTTNLLIIAKEKIFSFQHAKYFSSETLTGVIGVLKINSIGIYLARYFGNEDLFLNSQILEPDRIYIFSQGSTIRSPKVEPVYYSDIAGQFMSASGESNIEFDAKNIEYEFKNGKKGLHSLSFSENSGKLIGIMGGSGAGKSTLLNILNGNNPPSSGEVLVNGYDLHKEKKKLEGVIGFVPQDDLLIEELTVYQNLFYNSKLCFDGIPDAQINQKVIAMLHELGLHETKDLKVGNSLDKTISGGQRKRLNIALELIREPSVLFLDEPTSGLSSRDSENIMDLLKELTLKGKLVFVVIHQPSSDIFKMFDKLLILDTGGYPVYYGNPVESVVYFKKHANQVNADKSECITCGNVNPEQVFNIIESKVLDENGNQTLNRKISPAEWNEFYKTQIHSHSNNEIKSKQEISTSFRKPNFLNQIKVFVVRDVLSKISNSQYLAITLLEAPLLALILATLVKYFKSDATYVFYKNKNLPAFMFMCVLVALFVGLMVSAEEIIRDRKILKRESFLNLSKGSYLFSKIIIMFFVSAIQTLSFVLIGNYILEIRGMYVDYWLVLFTTSCCANMLGLNISSAFNSVVTIYILIPFLLIPQILLSGVLVKFDELNPKFSSQSVVPLSGDMMTSRWAFEALAVDQFINNKFEKPQYDFEKQKSNAVLKRDYWYSGMNSIADELYNTKNNLTEKKFETLKNEIADEMNITKNIQYPDINKLNKKDYNETIYKSLKEYLSKIKKQYVKEYNDADKIYNDWIMNIQNSEAGKAEYIADKNDYQNEKLEQLVKNDNIGDAMIEEDGRLVPTKDGIFRDGSDEHLIRSHFFAPRKNVFGNYYSTFWVNLLVIWMMSLVLWITLYYDALRKALDFFGKLPTILKYKK